MALPARDDTAIIALTVEKPFLLVVDNDGKVAIRAAFQSFDSGFLEFLTLDDTAIGVVQLGRQRFLEISVVELGLTSVGMGTGDVLSAKCKVSVIGEVPDDEDLRLSELQRRPRSSCGYILDRSCDRPSIEP